MVSRSTILCLNQLKKGKTGKPKMSLYPSLEDMKVDNMVRVQMAQQVSPSYNTPPLTAAPTAPPALMYPALGEYMGLELSQEVIALNMPEYRLQTVRSYWSLIYLFYHLVLESPSKPV